MILLPQLHKGLASSLRRPAHQTLPQHEAQNRHFGSMCGPHSLRHEPNRGFGGKTASKQVARRLNLPSGGRFSNITEDVRKYAAERSETDHLWDDPKSEPGGESTSPLRGKCATAWHGREEQRVCGSGRGGLCEGGTTIESNSKVVREHLICWP